MKVLVIGGGGREHAVCHALRQSAQVREIFCAPGNGGTAAFCQNVAIKATDIAGVVDFARAERIDYVVVTPDDPLALGMVDALEKAGIPAFGHNAACARLEGSKAHAKRFMARHGIPTADFDEISGLEQALAHVERCVLPVVIKADGLAAGKGVKICHTREEARAAVASLSDPKQFGAAGGTLVFEEFLAGPEVSVMCFTDGRTLRFMPAAQDHKRLLDGDNGPNTGGMGAFSPVSCYDRAMHARCLREIYEPTLAGLCAEGTPPSGVIYFSLMLTARGPAVIEYNMRLGDPETQAVLPLLKTDLFKIMRACTAGTLGEVEITWRDQCACCVVLASKGYPGAYTTGHVISGDMQDSDTVTVYHAGTKMENDALKTAGGRVLGVTARADTLRAAIARAYEVARGIVFEGVFYRTDIGANDEEAGK